MSKIIKLPCYFNIQIIDFCFYFELNNVANWENVAYVFYLPSNIWNNSLQFACCVSEELCRQSGEWWVRILMLFVKQIGTLEICVTTKEQKCCGSPLSWYRNIFPSHFDDILLPKDSYFPNCETLLMHNMTYYKIMRLLFRPLFRIVHCLWININISPVKYCRMGNICCCNIFIIFMVIWPCIVIILQHRMSWTSLLFF